MLYVVVTFLTALSISLIAIYYSVAGLVAIFSAAAVPIVIMGTVLEVSKLVTAVWLHKFWKQAVWWLKTYLTTAVVILMFITSMGIFGFLSKAHIEQTAAGQESIAQEQRINAEIARYQTAIVKAEEKIQKLEQQGTGGQSVLQAQIDREQSRIDAAYTRVQPLIDEQNNIIKSATNLFESELEKIDRDLETLQNYINTDQIEKAQAMVGTKVDGNYGPNTALAFTNYQDKKSAERSEWLDKIQNAANTETVKQSKAEIARIRTQVEAQIAESNQLINSYKAQLQGTEAQDISALLAEEQEKIKNSNLELDNLLSEKFQLQSDVRKLEAEVGPIKYIAEMVYGEATDKNILEKAVRWVIITIIFVFDPLAVLLLIASQYTIGYIAGKNDTKVTFKNPIKNFLPIKSLIDKKTVNYAQLYADSESQDDILNRRYLDLLDLESDVNYKKAKAEWKKNNPADDLKTHKQAYLEGKIDELPWKVLMIDK